MPLAKEDSQISQDSQMTIIDEDRHEILYFAYGSNMSTAQMRQRCPYSMPIGLGFLPGWRWIINERGYANIVQQDSQTGAGVFGLLYLLPPRDEDSLDVFEGVGYAYGKSKVDVTWKLDGEKKSIAGGSGQVVRALVYTDEQRTAESAPLEEYIRRMETAIDDAVENWGLDRGYAAELRRFWA